MTREKRQEYAANDESVTARRGFLPVITAAALVMSMSFAALIAARVAMQMLASA